MILESLSGMISGLFGVWKPSTNRHTYVDNLNGFDATRVDVATSTRASATNLQTVDTNVDAILANTDVATSTRLATAVNSLQTGYVDADMLAGAAGGEYHWYYNVTVTAVNTAKAYCFFQGGAFLLTASSTSGGNGFAMIKFNDGLKYALEVTAAMNGTTQLRLGTRNPISAGSNITERIVGRWYVIEFK